MAILYRGARSFRKVVGTRLLNWPGKRRYSRTPRLLEVDGSNAPYLLPAEAELGAARRVAPERIMAALRIFGWLGSGLGRSERIAEKIPREFLRERLARKNRTGGARPRDPVS